ncbi:MAG: AsmA family protein [Chromatiales bacterium]|nr:MAG: AsmA family protein [Chromatiales bacterium]
MKTLLKLILGLLGAAVILVLAAIIAVLLFVDPNDYRDEIAAAVERQTGRTLAIDGDLGLALLPCCGIRLEQTSLSNPPGFDTPQFASVERVRLGLAIWPLLMDKSLVIGEVDLQGLDVELVRRADGRDNWTFVSADDTPPESDGPADDTGPGATSLSIAGINIGDARLAYRDEVETADYRVEQLNLQTGAVAPGEPFDLEGGFQFQDAGTGTQADIGLKAVVNVDLEAQRARLDDAKLELELAGQSLPAEKIATRLTVASVDYDLEGGVAKLANIAGDVALSGGALPADAADLKLQLAGLAYDVNAGTATLNALDAEVAARGGTVPADGLDATVRLAKLDYNVDSGAGALQELEAEAAVAGAQLRLNGGGVLKATGTSLKGRFELPTGSPREWLAALGEAAPETADPAVLSRLQASGGWALGDDSLALDGLQVQLDDTAVTGDLAVSKFDAPRVRIALVVDAVDLDRYGAPSAEEDAGDGDEAGATELPRDELRELYLDGTLRVGELKVNDLRLQQVAATARARDGVLTLEPLTALLYGGRYDGSIRVDATGAQTRLDMRQSLDAVQVAQLLTDLADVEQLEGLVVAKLNLTGTGKTDVDLRNTLAGSVSFQLSEGVYKGLDIWHEIRKARALIKGEAPPARTGPAQTEITALDFAGQLVDGTLNSERMVAQLPFLRVTGDGALNLADESLNYRFNARVLQIPEFPDGERLKDLEGWSIPLLLSGTLENPKLGVDLAEFAKTRAAQEIRDKLFDKLGLEKKREPAPATAPDTGTAGEPAEAPADESQAAPEPEPEQQREEQRPPTPEDILKRGLEDLFGR